MRTLCATVTAFLMFFGGPAAAMVDVPASALVDLPSATSNPVQVKHDKFKYKYKWERGGCKYEYKADRKGVNEKYKCK